MLNSETIINLTTLQVQTPPPTPVSSQSGGLFGALVYVLILAGILYIATTVMISAPIGLFLIRRYGPYGPIKDSVIPPVVGLCIYSVILIATFLPELSELIFLWTVVFIPAGLVLLLIGYIGHRWLH